MNDRLKEAREEFGHKSASDAIRAHGWVGSTYRAHENKQNKFDVATAEAYGRAYKVNAAWLLTGEGEKYMIAHPNMPGKLLHGSNLRLPHIPILGRVAAASWTEIMQSQAVASAPASSPFPPDPRYPLDAQFDMIVDGTSINRFAQPGEALRCINIVRSGVFVNDGDLVIVERTRAGILRETSAKRLRRKGRTVELWPDSDDPLWQEPIIVNSDGLSGSDEVAIIAKVLWKYREA